MSEGRIVATNLDLFIDKLMPPTSRALSFRLPDVPTAAVLNDPNFPQGNNNPIDEAKNGLLILDECAGYLNARDWKDKDRTALIAWLAQSRKNGWDLLLIAQGASMIDKQIRNELCDMHGVCRETSKIGIPFITMFARQIFGIKLMMPKFHLVSYFYGFGATAVKSYTDIFRSLDVQNGYNTLQKISAEFGQQGISSNLPAWHLRGRYMSRWEMYGKIFISSLILGALIGLAGGFYGHDFIKPQSKNSSQLIAEKEVFKIDETVFVNGVVNDGLTFLVMLSDGRMERSTEFKTDLSGSYYKVGSKWYGEKK
jgi:hypothetical protein